jgi:hypothetical protein
MGEAAACFNLALLFARQSQPADVIASAERARQLFEQIGHHQYSEKAQGLLDRIRNDFPDRSR